MMRQEKDSLGSMEIPEDALYGIHAARAEKNFPNHSRFQIEWYKAMGLTKQAFYLTMKSYGEALRQRGVVPGEQPGRLPDDLLNRMAEAAAEVAAGLHFDHFIVPAVQGGAGTSINMNVNEIIANVALLKAGRLPGDYGVIDPVLHANCYQSTNDVVPTALKVAAMLLLNELESEINTLRFAVERLESAHHRDLRIGYTQMQEAVPSSYGRLFSSYNEGLSRDWWRISKCFERLKLVNPGGGAIGTGVAVPRYVIMECIGVLQQLTGLPVTRSENLADATSNHDALVEVHASMKAHAVNLEKMVSDLRLLASDLSVTRGQLILPKMQVGSSVMPGKVNPVIPEFVIGAAHSVYANDLLITSLCGQGCLELNAYLPVIGHALLDSLKLLIACNRTLRNNLFDGIIIHPETSLEQLHRSPAITTALLPLIGYHDAGRLAAEMNRSGGTVFEANEVLGMIDPVLLREMLVPERLLQLGFTLKDLERGQGGLQ